MGKKSTIQLAIFDPTGRSLRTDPSGNNIHKN